jgi:tetratricopeptide (TPR) repeat protein
VKEGPHPAGLADWVRVRLERLTEEARGLMNVASVIGLESAFEVLLDVGSFDESRLIDITEQLLLAHFLEPTRAGFRFHHGIVREIVYSRISPARRAQLHRKVARSIERIYAACLDDHVEALAHHNTLGDRVDEAIHYLTLAGDRALSIYSNELAIKHYTSALELVPGRDRAVASRLLERLGDVRSVTGSVAIAVHTYISAIETGGEGTDDAARRHRKAAYQLILQSRLDEAERHLAAARKDLDESSNQVELARLHYTVSHLHWHRLEFEPAKNAAEASLRAAEKADSQPDKMLAYEALALTHLPMGDWKRGMEYESRRQSLCDLNQDIAAISDVHL